VKRKKTKDPADDSDIEDNFPDKKKTKKMLTRNVSKKETIARPCGSQVELQLGTLGKLLMEAHRNKLIAKATDVIEPRDKEIYIIKGGSIQTVKLMDNFSWKHNGKAQVGEVGQRYYYQGRLDIKNVIQGLRKTVIELQGQHTFVVHYKIDLEEEVGPKPGPAGAVATEPLKAKGNEERKSGTLRKLVTKSMKAAALMTNKKEQTAQGTTPALQLPAVPRSGDNLPQPANVVEDQAEEAVPVAQTKRNVAAAKIKFPKVFQEAQSRSNGRQGIKINKREAKKILAQSTVDDMNIATQTVIANPKGGEVYLFDVSGFDKWRKHLNRDTYMWKPYPRSEKGDLSVKEIYSYVIGHNRRQCSKFTKRIIHFPDKDKVLIAYDGDHEFGAHFEKNTRPSIDCNVQNLEGQKAKAVCNQCTNQF
jgi:hypothetical protein